MTFNNYEIPKEYIDKYKVTLRDKRDFQKFWINELVALKEMPNLSKDDVSSIHNALIYAFWAIKGKNKEKYTPAKYKNNIYIKQN